MSTIVIKNAVKKFKNNTVIDDVSLTLTGGNVYGFVGRNGSGKTMLFRAISGLIHIDSGSISIDGKTLHKDIDALPSVGIAILKPKLVLMRRLMKLAPVYYVMGNHETDADEKSSALNCKLEEIGVHVLRNTHERIYRGNEYINLYGAELPLECYRADGRGYRGLKSVDVKLLDKLMGTPDPEKCCVLLSHSPFPFKAYAEWGADIVFSGHCHGGVIRLPIVGGLLSPERKFFPEYTRGLYKRYGSTMVVSAGLGKFRLNNPSQLICATLTGK